MIKSMAFLRDKKEKEKLDSDKELQILKRQVKQ